MGYIHYEINSKFHNYSVSEYLRFYKLSKNKVKELSLPKAILINHENATLKSILKKGDILSLYFNEIIDFMPFDYQLKIIYEDNYLLILDKPNGFLVHPDDKEKNGTLVNMVAHYYQQKKLDRHVRYIHRLDRETTGLIIFAKDPLTNSYLNDLLSTHQIQRTYLALCSGVFAEKKGVIDEKIGEDRHHNQRRRVSKTGQEAITYFEVLKEIGNQYSLVSLQLKTGRTHQIRVHMKYIGHPLLGDELYGGSFKKIKRVALHSYKVSFIHPHTFQKLDLEALLPNDMKDLIK